MLESNIRFSFFSKKFLKHQLNYSTIEKEALALLLAIQHFEVYIGSSVQPITVYTDHNPLVFLQRMSNANHRLMRWALICQGFNLNIQHKKGVENIIADTLSRIHSWKPMFDFKDGGVTSPVYRSVYVFLSVSVQEKVRPEFILIGDPEILIGHLLIGLVPVPVKRTSPNILDGRMCAICFDLIWFEVFCDCVCFSLRN